MRKFGFSSIILQAAFRRILRTKPVVFNPVKDFNFLCNVVRLVAISSTKLRNIKIGIIQMTVHTGDSILQKLFFIRRYVRKELQF